LKEEFEISNWKHRIKSEDQVRRSNRKIPTKMSPAEKINEGWSPGFENYLKFQISNLKLNF